MQGTSVLARLYQDDGLYEGGAAAAMRLPMFTGNHDFGRLAWIIRAARPNATDDEVLKRVMLGERHDVPAARRAGRVLRR